jgi:hypothetical protein
VEGGILPPGTIAAMMPLPRISKTLMIADGCFRRLEARLYVSQDG